MSLPDLNNTKNIDEFIYSFYKSIFSDDFLSPIFNKRIKNNLQEHLNSVSLYWQKILLGDKRYTNNIIKIHNELNLETPLNDEHYRRWHIHFKETAQGSYSGIYTDKAIQISCKIITNMSNILPLK